MKNKPGGEVILYQTEDLQTRLQVRLDGQTAWLTQAQMAELFQTTIPNINLHLKNVFAEGELQEDATIKEHLIVRQEGQRQVSRGGLALQSGSHYRRRLPRKISARHAIPHLGDGAVEGISRERFHDGRRAAEKSAGQGADGLFRRTAGAHPRHPVVGTAVLPEGAGHLRDERGLHAGCGTVAEVFCHGAEQNALGDASATLRRRSSISGRMRENRLWGSDDDAPGGRRAERGCGHCQELPRRKTNCRCLTAS